ncbi:MAG: hypothetical protein GY943_39245 [Chloroflexi bacterium]|nr:hypothetical protein [Chloroflexota bacterium]
MITFQQSLATVLAKPTPTALWQLRGDLLQADIPATASIWQVIDQFFTFLNNLNANLKDYEFSKMATLLDIGAIGGVAIQGVIEGNLPLKTLWKRLLAGTVGEGLMVLASRQYIKGAQAELIGVYQDAAWYLFDALWHVSAQLQPSLSAADRRRLLDELFAPALQEEADDAVKIVLLGRLFQLLLVVNLSKL